MNRIGALVLPAALLPVLPAATEAAHQGAEVEAEALPEKIELIKGRAGARLLGHPVQSPPGTVLGKLADFGIEAGTNRVFAVISLGGIMGGGARRVAVPFDALDLGHSGYVVYQGDVADLKARPSFRPTRESP